MNREEIAVKLMEKHPKDFASKAAAMRAVSGVFDIIEESVAGGEAVVLTGFGSFSVKERAARVARNPQTGEPIEISAKRVPTFRVGKAFKDKVM